MSAAVSVSPYVKVCACSLAYTQEGWDSLPDAKRYTLEWGEVHEQRRCWCGSHIVIVLEEGTPEEPRPPQFAPEGSSAEEEAIADAAVAKWRASRGIR